MTNSDGCKYGAGLLRKCIDASGYDIDIVSLRGIRNQIEQAGADGDIAKVNDLSFQYVLLSVTQIANLLSTHWNEVSPVSPLVKSKYLQIEKLLMRRFGL